MSVLPPLWNSFSCGFGAIALWLQKAKQTADAAQIHQGITVTDDLHVRSGSLCQSHQIFLEIAFTQPPLSTFRTRGRAGSPCVDHPAGVARPPRLRLESFG